MNRKYLYLAMALLGLGGAGCSDDPNAPPVGPDIRGEWSGTYHDPGGPVIPLSAVVGQSAQRVVKAAHQRPAEALRQNGIAKRFLCRAESALVRSVLAVGAGNTGARPPGTNPWAAPGRA